MLLATALHVVNLLRLEKAPPTARYCTLLILAARHPKPMSAVDIADIMETSSRTSTLERMVEQGLIKCMHHTKRDCDVYQLLPAGHDEITRITGIPAPVPALPVPQCAAAN
jgi:DNA-binding PadR family transcriptional regulator